MPAPLPRPGMIGDPRQPSGGRWICCIFPIIDGHCVEGSAASMSPICARCRNDHRKCFREKHFLHFPTFPYISLRFRSNRPNGQNPPETGFETCVGHFPLFPHISVPVCYTRHILTNQSCTGVTEGPIRTLNTPQRDQAPAPQVHLAPLCSASRVAS